MHGERAAGPSRSAAAFGVVALLAFACLAWRAAPVVTYEDSGELIAAAHVFGVPHPPGYPLFALLCGAWMRLLGAVGVAPAHAAALFSALFAALAQGVVAFVAARRAAPLAVAAVAGLLPLAFPTFACVATTCEVYALAAFLQAVLVACALDPRPRASLAFGAFSLGLAAHPATLFLAPLALVAWWRARPLGRGERGRSIVALALGPLAFLYVPLRAASEPAVNWGAANTWPRLVDHVLRSQYAVGIERTGADLAELARFALEQTLGQAPLPFALGMLGAVVLARRDRAVLGLLATVVFAFVASAYAVRYPLARLDPWARWAAETRLAPSFTPIVVALAVLAPVGLVRLAAVLRDGRARAALVVALLALGGFHHAPRTRGIERAAASRGAAEYARAVLDECPQDAICVVNRLDASDVLGFPLLERQVVDGVRTDVVVVDRQLLLASWYREQLAARAPDLAPWCDALGAALPANGDLGEMHRTVGAALAHVGEGGRAVVLTDVPGAAVLQGRTLHARRTTWHFEAPTELDAGPSAAWLLDEPRSPWRALHRDLALERDRDRADALRRAGRTDEADALRAEIERLAAAVPGTAEDAADR
ncbi:MAG: DUF2723 domain-containing protein [Planctomycetota bacterium]